MKSGSLAIRNGLLIDPAEHLEGKYDLLLKDGRVVEVAAAGKLRGKADDTFNARGLVVAPGFIDIHVHLREPGQSHKETIASGTMAAAAGGFTSVCTMPNTSPVNDSPEITRWMLDPARGAHVNVFPVAAATVGSRGEQLTDFAALKRAGAVAVSDDGKPILDDKIMRQTLIAAAALNMPVVQHAEDCRMTEGSAMNAGPTAFRLGLRGWPGEAESTIVERDIRLTAETKGRYHVAHLSTAAALRAVRKAKRDHLRVTCEITPHHFTLLDEDVGQYDTNYKMNPPLRSREDREALLAGLADGAVDCVATDHAPHAAHEKNQEFDRAPFGITGLETALGLVRLSPALPPQYSAAADCRTALRQSCARHEPARPRHTGRGRPRRRHDFRSGKEMDLPRRAVALKIKEFAVRWEADAGESDGDGGGWGSYIPSVAFLKSRSGARKPYSLKSHSARY